MIETELGNEMHLASVAVSSYLPAALCCIEPTFREHRRSLMLAEIRGVAV